MQFMGGDGAANADIYGHNLVILDLRQLVVTGQVDGIAIDFDVIPVAIQSIIVNYLPKVEGTTQDHPLVPANNNLAILQATHTRQVCCSRAVVLVPAASIVK